MLKQRIITGLILIAVVLAVILALPSAVFTILCRLVVFLAAWEWAGIIGFGALWQRFTYLLAVALLLHLCLQWLPEIMALKIYVAAWILASLSVLRFPQGKSLWQHPLVALLSGLVLITGAGYACLHLRAWPLGQWWILQLLLLVWASDIGAYFAGRAWGKKTLAPQVSPSKTQLGALGGFLSACLVGFLTAHYFPLPAQPWFAILGLSAFTNVAAVIGDLFESMIKRCYGVKDSGYWLPGHGGILDRIDALLAAAPIFLACLWGLGFIK